MLLIFRLLAAVFLLSVSRWMIYMFNIPMFQGVDLWDAVRFYFVGLRFDLVVIAYINFPIILYYCTPFCQGNQKLLQKIIDVLYVTANSLAIILNIIDVFYFRFMGNSLSYEFFVFFSNSNKTSSEIIGQLFADYWFMIVIGLLFVIVLIVVTRWTRLRRTKELVVPQWDLRQITRTAFFAIFTIIACRGGLQAEPIDMTTALRYSTRQNTPIIVNTAFAIAINRPSPSLSEYHVTDTPSFSPVHSGIEANRFIQPDDSIADNMVLIILDGFGQETIGYYNSESRRSLTPFLDSLFAKSLTFDGIANGLRSIEGLPSLMCGIPSLMEAFFMTSSYVSNDIEGIGNHLKRHGYQTLFFHCGDKAFVNLPSFVKRIGFDHYFARYEYDKTANSRQKNNISEKPFLLHAIHNIDTTNKPFGTVFYTSSSLRHVRLPEQFVFPSESYAWSKFEKSVYYTDCALRDFFTEASSKEWFENTIFIITASHANVEHYHVKYDNIWGMYKIPIAFYCPKRIVPVKSHEIVQQTDLNVSTVAALNLSDTVFSFGRNVFDSLSKSCSINYLNHSYLYSNGKYLIQSDGTKTIGVYRVEIDSLLHDDLIDHIQCPDLHHRLSEQIQEYHDRMINNKLIVNKHNLNGQTKDTIHH